MEYAVICGHRNLKYMYIYLYMHVLKTAQKIVKSMGQKTIFSTLVLFQLITYFLYISSRASLVAQRLKCLPGMRETWVRSLSQEDPLEKERATHSSTFAWRIPQREEPGRL